MVQFLLKHLLKQISRCSLRFPLIANCYKIVSSQTSCPLCQGVGNFGKFGVGVVYFTSDSATLISVVVHSQRIYHHCSSAQGRP